MSSSSEPVSGALSACSLLGFGAVTVAVDLELLSEHTDPRGADLIRSLSDGLDAATVAAAVGLAVAWVAEANAELVVGELRLGAATITLELASARVTVRPVSRPPWLQRSSPAARPWAAQRPDRSRAGREPDPTRRPPKRGPVHRR